MNPEQINERLQAIRAVIGPLYQRRGHLGPDGALDRAKYVEVRRAFRALRDLEDDLAAEAMSKEQR